MRKTLQLRFPPMVMFLFWAIFMRALHWADSGPLDFEFLGQRWFAVALLVAGLIVAAAGVLAFWRARTPVDPLHPNKTSRLVTDGIYRFTRNPMYLSMALLLLSWGLYLGSLTALLFMPFFAVYLTEFQIVPEERHLMRKFGGAFQRYRKRVRRWL